MCDWIVPYEESVNFAQLMKISFFCESSANNNQNSSRTVYMKSGVKKQVWFPEVEKGLSFIENQSQVFLH